MATLASRPANERTSEWLVVSLELSLGHKRLLVIHRNQHNAGVPNSLDSRAFRSPLTSADHLSAVPNLLRVETPFRSPHSTLKITLTLHKRSLERMAS